MVEPSAQASAAIGDLLLQQEEEMLAAMRAVDDRIWSLEEARRRCGFVKFIMDPEQRETFCIDGVPMVEFWPITSSMDSRENRYVLTAHRRFRRLYTAKPVTS